MKKLTKVIMSGVAVAAMGCTMAVGLTGCGGDGELEINITGSTSVQPVMQVLADNFAAKYEEEYGQSVTINVNGGGSGVGVNDAKQGTVDFGMASRELKSDETGIVAKTICMDGIALVVNSSCSVSDVTLDEVKALYEAGTTIQSVISYGVCREDGSGTRSAFEEIVGIEKIASTNQEIQNSTGGVKTVISGNSQGNTVGYISMGSLDSTVKALKVGGVEATVANVKSGTYKLARPFNIVYRSEEGLSEITKLFIEYIMGAEGQATLVSSGYVSMA